jgi:hypothetical protein
MPKIISVMTLQEYKIGETDSKSPKKYYVSHYENGILQISSYKYSRRFLRAAEANFNSTG